MNEQISNKIRVAGLICTIMVLYRHSLNYLAFFGNWNGEGISRIVENSFSILTEIAVPFFFVVSGFFFLKKDYNNYRSYFLMVKGKFKSLIIPFLFWNLIGLLVMSVVAFGDVRDMSFGKHLSSLLFSEWYGPLWYVRDLITMMLFVPLYGWIFKRAHPLVLTIMGVLLFLYWIPVDCSWVSSEGVFFFYLGGMISKRDSLLTYKAGIVPFAIIGFVWISLIVVLYGHSNVWVEKVCILTGIFSLWNAIDLLSGRMNNFFIRYSSYAFFLYVTHFYLEKILKSGVAHFFYGNDIAAVVTYLIVPVITILLVIPIGILWRKLSIGTYSIVVGGRA